jgi:hypothetical protein
MALNRAGYIAGAYSGWDNGGALRPIERVI